jgi:hypothetical protein
MDASLLEQELPAWFAEWAEAGWFVEPIAGN